MSTPYEVLGVPNSASEIDIKKAFRTLAMKHHPDKGGDSETFKKISEAYNVLIDPVKKQEYDGFGTGIIPRHVVNVPLTLREFYNGCDKVYVRRNLTPCKACNGLGGKNPHVCSTCGQRFPSMLMCAECRGTGVVFEEKCKVCNGFCNKLTETTTKLHIPKGTSIGQRFEQPGHLTVVVQLKSNYDKESELKWANGNDLEYCCTLNLHQAISGGTIFMKHLDDRMIKINLPPCKQFNDQFIIKREGLGSEYKKGDLIISTRVEPPANLSEKQMETLRQIFAFDMDLPPRVDQECTAQVRSAPGRQHHYQNSTECKQM